MHTSNLKTPANHINRRQAPRIKAAVPVQTPLDKKKSQHQSTHSETSSETIHQPLQRRELDSFNPLPQTSNFLLNTGLCFLNPHLLAVRLFANSALLEIEI